MLAILIEPNVLHSKLLEQGVLLNLRHNEIRYNAPAFFLLLSARLVNSLQLLDDIDLAPETFLCVQRAVYRSDRVFELKAFGSRLIIRSRRDKSRFPIDR
jgi:hypothetical protein